MIENPIIRILLIPFALLYGLGVSLRNLFYRIGTLKAVEFNLPIISIGNLSVGGSGKTPHTEFLIRQLREYINVATLSRGYKRKTKGFREVFTNHTAELVGDEPLQFKRKYPDVMVTVSESRTFGIPEILNRRGDTQLILLDDAFQHRSVKPGLNILLTEFERPFTQDYLLPVGRLREWRSGYQRADIIIVSKCPDDLTEADRELVRKEINLFPNQQLFFSKYKYLEPYYIFNSRHRVPLAKDLHVLMVSAIANTDYLVSYLEPRLGSIKTLEYEDHHQFTGTDISNIKRHFDQLPDGRRMILTTEKDAVRLYQHQEYLLQQKLPIFALPVEVEFLFEEGELFMQNVREYLLDFKH
ncbi:MAG: tetraacyldisaccharide 4'-kinase [Saprospiraceae bacterium]|nr:tetraacyldisaccharide 4'-kinase [Saprospiraceae bacterium]